MSARVWVLMYEHRHGHDVFVRATSEAIERLVRELLLEDGWDTDFLGAIPSDLGAAMEVYGNWASEWFSWDEHEVMS